MRRTLIQWEGIIRHVFTAAEEDDVQVELMSCCCKEKLLLIRDGESRQIKENYDEERERWTWTEV